MNQPKTPPSAAKARFDRLFVTGGGALADEEPDLTGTRIGPYRVDSVIDEGGTARVYEASRCDDAFRQTVAIKVLNRNADRFMQRFLQERQHLADLQHAAIARIIDAGKTPDGRPYLVMDRIEGKPVNDYVAAANTTREDIVRLMVKVCRVVAHAHEAGIFHHDIKPGNILIDHQGNPRLLDFGIATVERSTATDAELLTPRFAAPEQFDRRTEGAATDVFQLGLLLASLVDDDTPLGARNSVGELSQQSGDIANQWRQKMHSMDVRSRELRAIMIHCCEPKPERRYPHVESLVDDLESWLVGKPVSTLPRALPTRLTHSMRSRPAVWAGTMSLALILGMAAWYLVSSRIEDESRKEALASMLSDVLEAQDDASDVIVNSSFELAGGALADDPETEKRVTESSARGLLRRGRVVEARELLVSVIGRAGFGFESDSNYGNLHALLGDAYLRESNLAEAEKHLLIARRSAQSEEMRETAERGLEFIVWAAASPVQCDQARDMRSEWTEPLCGASP